MRKGMCSLAGVVCAVLAVTFVANAADTAQRPKKFSPKNIYYEPGGGGPIGPTPVGPGPQAVVRFWVDLYPRDGGQAQTLTADHVFHNLDRTRFRVATNVNCYVYVAHQGSSGNRALLFPSVDAGRDNRVRAREAKVMPSNRGYFTFDETPGNEFVVIVISPDRIPELEDMATARVGENPRTRSVMLTKEENAIWSKLQKKLTGKEKGASTRDIVIESENEGPQIGNYGGIDGPFSQPIILNITLKHER